MLTASLLGLFLLAAPDGTTPPPAPPEPSTLSADLPVKTRILATSLALVPGPLVPGIGHRIEGDHVTANRLLLASGSATAGAIAGLVALSLTRGDHDLAPLYLPVLFGSAATLLASWACDVLGSARPGGWRPLFDEEESARVSVLYGINFQRASDVDHLGLFRAEYENRSVRVDGWASAAPGTSYHEAHLRAGFKLVSDGKRSNLSLLAEGISQGHAGSDTTALGGMLVVEGRLDAGLLSAPLTGIGLLQRLGFGGLFYSHPNAPSDLQAILVMEFGVALAPVDWLELQALYSQRPDNRLGQLHDHWGSATLQARVEVLPHLRLVLLSHLGGGADVMAGVEAAW